MSGHPNPLTDEQERALRRTLGSAPGVEIVMVVAASHFVRVEGRRAMELEHTHFLPGGRAIRYARDGQRLFVADVAV
jgi:hypothetical protein